MALPGASKLSQHAVQTIHWLLPLIAALYYVTAILINLVCGHQTKKQKEEKTKNVWGTATFWSMLAVLIAYVFDSAALLYVSFVDNPAIASQDSIVFAFSSVLLWFTLVTGSLERRISSWYPSSGCFVMYLVAEILLPILAPDNGGQKRSLQMALDFSRIIRLICIVVLLGIATGSRTVSGKHKSIDEEARPLLGGDCRDGDNCPRTCSDGVRSYGATPCSPARCDDSGLLDRESRGKGSDLLDSVTFLLPFFWPKDKPLLQLAYGGVGLCLLADRVLNVLVPLQLGRVTNTLSQNNAGLPTREIMIFVALRLLDSSGGISAVRRYLWLPLDNYSYLKISTAAFNKIMTLSSDFHDNKHSGSLWEPVSRGLSVRYTLRAIFFQIAPMIVDLILAVSVLYCMFDAYMALIVATVVIMFLWSSGRILSKQQDQRRQLIANQEKEHNILCESTSNWRTALYFNRIPYEKIRYCSAVTDHTSSSNKFFRWVYFESVAQSSVLVLGLMGACFLAAYQVVSTQKPVGSFVTLLSYWAQLSGPLQFFASGLCEIALDLVNAEELISLMKRNPTVSDHDHAKPLMVQRGSIEFQGVGFSYDGRRQVLNKISFQAPPGQTVALVGETGGGKSTILKLLLRLYEPSQGTITIDGQNVRDVTQESLRANIGVVPQDPTLFHDTILNNIKYASPSATDEQVYEACRAVALHDKFLAFTDGYQTLVGERGVKLSGGELQRVAIARAMIKNPKIILLDEATSSVDSNTEAQIQESLEKLSAGRTTFVIAHRLSTVMNAKKILVIHNGELVEQGSHNTLLKVKGFYSGLWSRQVMLQPRDGMAADNSTQSKRGALVQTINGDLPVQEMEDSSSAVADELRRHPRTLSDSDKAHPERSSKSTSSLYRTKCSKMQQSSSRLVEHSTATNDSTGSKRNIWKPDAPEFVPGSQRTERMDLPTFFRPRTSNHPGIPEPREVSKENIRGMCNELDENNNVTCRLINYDNGDKPMASQTRRDSEENDSGQFATALKQTTNMNGTGAAATTKPEETRMKSKKPKKRRDLRRALSKSEPV